MRTKLALLSAVAIALVVLAVQMISQTSDLAAPVGNDSPVAAEGEPTELDPGPPDAPRPISESPGLSPSRESIAQAPTQQSGDLEPAGITVSGRALNALGQPAPGVAFRIVPPFRGLAEVTSGADGLLTLALNAPAKDEPDVRSTFVPVNERLLTVMDTGLSAYAVDNERDILVAVGPGRSLSGTVIDEAGVGIAGAELTFELPGSFRSRFNSTLSGAREQVWRTETSPGGAFAFEVVPAGFDCVIEAGAPGFERSKVDPVPPGEGPLEISLTRQDDLGQIRGMVLDANDQSVDGALVGLGTLAQRTEADGRFAFRIDSEDAKDGPQRIVAVAKGFLPATFTPPTGPSGDVQWPAEISLRLTDPTLFISGRVVTPAGEPVPGAEVWVKDPTVIGEEEAYSPLLAEVVMAGGRGDLRNRVLAGVDGEFTMGGLTDRIYEVVAMAPESLAAVHPAVRVRAGAESVLLELGDSGMSFLAGLVVTGSGEPIPNATISVERTAAFVSVPGKGGAYLDDAQGRSTTTDPDGRFELGGVSLQSAVRVVVSAPNRKLFKRSMAELGMEPGDLRITLFSTCEVRLVGGPASDSGQSNLAGYAHFLDAAGERIDVIKYTSSSSMSRSESLSFSGGASSTVEVSDGAVQIELHVSGREKEIRAIRLTPGEVNVIDL